MTTQVTAGPRLLLVEDEYVLAQDLARRLHGLGAEIVAFAASVEKAIQLARNHAGITGAVLDIAVGDELIYPAIPILRERGVSIVFATARAAAVVPSEFRDIPLFRKPVSAVAILSALRN